MRKLSIKHENPFDNIIYVFVEILAPYMYKYNVTPNMITTLGNLSWIYGLYLLYDNEYIFSAILFALGYYFDCLDGYVARKYNQLSIFGDYYDHISDLTKGFCYLYTLYYLNSSLFLTIFPLIMIFSFLLILHLSYQEKLYNKKNNSPTLSSLNNLIPAYLQTNNIVNIKKRLEITKFFGTGTFNLLICCLIIYIGYSKDEDKK